MRQGGSAPEEDHRAGEGGVPPEDAAEKEEVEHDQGGEILPREDVAEEEDAECCSMQKSHACEDMAAFADAKEEETTQASGR